MKRLAIFILLVLGLVPQVGSANDVGLSVFGGMSIPIVQDDNGNGPLFGLRAPVGLMSHLNIEPFFTSTRNGDAKQDIGGVSYTRSGFDISTFGASLVFPFGEHTKYYPLVGFSTNALSRTGSSDQAMTGWNFGFGVGFSPKPKFVVDLRGEGVVIADGSLGRTFANVTLGVTYQVFNFASQGGTQP